MNHKIKITGFLLLNTICVIGSIIGFILWTHNTNFYYPFCSIITLIGLIIGVYLFLRDTVEDDTENSSQKNTFICISFCYTVLWVFAAITSTFAINQCSQNCAGVIISTIFGYILFLLWSLSFFITIIY